MARVPHLGSILTAIVTPFDDSGAVDEAAFVDLMGHLARTGTEGFVVCGTTGEASTLSTDEHLRVVELAVAEKPEGTTVTAGAGSNDTRHAVEMTERVCAMGVDAVLSVTPYYNRPNRRGLIAHYTEISRAADRPIVLYNIPNRTALDMPNDLLAELAQLDHIDAVKQANNDNLALVDGLELYAGNDDILARTLDLGGAGGILTGSHVVGPEMRRMADEPSERAAIHESLQPVFAALAVGPAAMTLKAALNMMGIRAGVPRLPYVEADQTEKATIRQMLEARGLVGAHA
jgi:4-hydroxy-tetrahydrodipicolinate synthase